MPVVRMCSSASTCVWPRPERSFSQHHHDHLKECIGQTLITVFGAFILLGGILGALAVLPGIWWLERAGILALGTGLAMYSVVAVTLGISPIGFLTGLAFIGTFVQRWMEIRKFQLAPNRRLLMDSAQLIATVLGAGGGGAVLLALVNGMRRSRPYAAGRSKSTHPSCADS